MALRGSNRKKKRVLLLKAGDVAPPLSLLAGDYDRWFTSSIDGASASLEIVQANRRQKLPAPRGYDAVMMTGSSLSVTQPAPWMDRSGEWMLEAAARKIPVLGVCFGLQLLARVLGGQVVKNRNGRETGSVQVRLTPQGQADPLFDGIPPRFVAQATHEDVIVPPPGTTALAYNANTAIQAAAFGKYLRGVQFHPELSAAGMRALVETRAERLDAEGVAKGEPPGRRITTLLSAISPSIYGRRVLENFLKHFS